MKHRLPGKFGWGSIICIPKYPGDGNSASVGTHFKITDVDHTERESRECMKTTHDQVQKCLTEAIRKTSMRPLYFAHSEASVLSLASIMCVMPML